MAHHTTTHTQPRAEDNLEDIRAAVSDGYTSFKFYTSLPDFSERTADYIRLMRSLGELGGLAMFHCEDNAIVTDAQRRLIELCRTQPRFYPLSKPQEAEVAATAAALFLASIATYPPISSIFHPRGRLTR
jgi:dihydropyrimidinase